MVDNALNGMRQEIWQSCMRYAIVIATGITVTLLFADEVFPPSLSAIGLVLFLFICASFLTMSHHFISLGILISGFFISIVLGTSWFDTPEYVLAYGLALIIITAFFAGGSRIGLVATCGASLVQYLGGRSGSPPNASPLLALAGMWSLAGLLALCLQASEGVLQWAWHGFDEAQSALEQARDNQADLKEALEDLAMANAEAVRLNEMLFSARKALEDARKAKQEFVANVSHELRTPLNMIIGFSDMILDVPETYSESLPAALLADVSAIRRNSQHLAELVNDVLDLSEADSRKMTIVREDVYFPEVIVEACDIVGGLFEKKGLALGVNVQPELPHIYCDRTRVRQVLLNLLSNAARFTEQGGTEITARTDNQMLVVSVSDSGPGMPTDQVARLFEPFQQGDPSIRRRFGGSGLGLAISKRLVEMHGGHIWIESDMGVGTTVFFSLPLGGELETAESRRWFSEYQTFVERPRTGVRHVDPPQQRVVVIEQGTSLKSMLQHHAEGIEIVAAKTLAEGIVAVETHAASALVVNDCQGVMDGLLLDLPQMRFSVPIISASVPERLSGAQGLGAQGYLVKPVSRSALFDVLEEVSPDARQILIADDDADARRLFGRMLASSDKRYVVLHARDGERAIELMRTRKPDLLLLDLVMPNVDGFRVLHQMESEPGLSQIPVVVLSAKDVVREPIISRSMSVCRRDGLSARDMATLLNAAIKALEPRYSAPERSEDLFAT